MPMYVEGVKRTYTRFYSCHQMLCVTAANSLTRKDHDPEAVTGEPSKLFRPVVYARNLSGDRLGLWYQFQYEVRSDSGEVAAPVVNRIPFLDWVGSTCFTQR